MATKSLKERILSNISIDENGCWIWQLFTDRDGYGWIKHERLTKRAHRVSYETFVGKIKDGLQIDHLCRNRSCVNPKHLEPVTCKENINRGNTGKLNSSKTHCPQGHEYSSANVIIETDRRFHTPSRKCRECVYRRNRIRKRQRTQERRVAMAVV